MRYTPRLTPPAEEAALAAPPRTAPPDPRYSSASLLRRFWRDYLWPRIGLLGLAFLLLIIEGSTLGLLSWMIQPLFDRVFAGGNSDVLLWVGFGIFGLFTLRAITSICGRWLLTQASLSAQIAMQTDMVSHILRMDGTFFHQHAPGSLIERVQGDTAAAQTAAQEVIMSTGRDIVALIGLFAVALSIDPVWTLATLIGVPLLILPAGILRRYIRRKAEAMREQAAARARQLDEIFHGIQTIKLNRMEVYQTTRFAEVQRRILRAEVRFAGGRAFLPAMIDVVTGLGFLAVLLLGGAEVASGERTTGEFMSFFTAMALTFQPIRRLSDLAGLWQLAHAALDRIYRLLDMPVLSTRPAESRALPAPGAPAITLDAVTFGYGDQPVLDRLSFTAEAGKVTAIVGPSGAGKSTLFQVLTALARPQSGRVLLGGVDVEEMSLADQRALFAVVTQDAALFDETLRENLIFGRPDIGPERLARALADANVPEFLSRLPGGLDAAAGPRGSALSGGQRQRIAIARALLADAPVLLLDEATSALDAASEKEITEALARARRGRTTLVIAHRLATVRDADRIIVLEGGHLAEEGTHADLLAQDGLYARLHALQFRE